MPTTRTGRASVAHERLGMLLDARPETRHQALDTWLQSASPGEVRKHWKRVVWHCGLTGRRAALPPWAEPQ